MNTYTVCKPRKALLSAERSSLLLGLSHAVILCLGIAGAAAVLECRLAALALGAAVLLLGCLLILSGIRLGMLLLGTGIALGGVVLISWSVWRMVSRQPLTVELYTSLTGLAAQLCIFAGGIAFLAVPVRRIERAAGAHMVMVKAQCIASPPEQDCILWRFRLGDTLYDWRETRCAGFFLPCMGDCCILYADTQRPGQAVRIDRRMAAAQMAVGVLLLIEVMTAAASNF